MKKFAKIDDENCVVSTTNDPQGEGWIECPDWVVIDATKIMYESGEFRRTGESWMKSSYAQQRSMAYPPIGDQLDVLWKALGSMLEDQRAEAMLAQIQAVKDRYPKPSN